MPLTPATIRLDLRCGPGSKPCGSVCIPRAHDCQITGGAGKASGGFSWAKANRREKVGAVTGLATTAAGVGTSFHGAVKGNFAQAEAGLQLLGVGQGVLGGTLTAQGLRTGNTKTAASGALLTGAGVFNTRKAYKGMRAELRSKNFNNKATPLTNLSMRSAALPGNLKGRARLALINAKRPRGKAKIGPGGRIENPWS